MILMRIVTPVAQDQVRRSASCQRFKPVLDVSTLVGEEPVLELRQIDNGPGRVCQELLGGCARLVGAGADGTEHRPVHVQADAAIDPAEDRGAGADFYVVGMSTDAEHGKALAWSGEPKMLHP